ncbi:HAD family hydrolase [Chryseobacterium sp. D764]|jgi:phosphoglycolate phosphatase|uniref:HAD family hydrolase n=1 Tax=unclassified Chryseobacterium TaxID=2593645 RepID=UPI0009862692|nr:MULTISPECIES: HAD family hydrolase [unclassified Chryseobacterium]QXU48374.1 HAD family hydrolase [Chryseobacterium sp. D764]CAD0222966.1 Phosphoglycolate phosphatase [Chryseobacterium sp. JV274]
MNIFFDLDGTLIDSRPRLYHLFQSLVPTSELSFDEYWTLKRGKKSHKEILLSKFNYSSEQYSDFEKKWMSEIELEKWLKLDTPFEGIVDLLINLSKNYTLFVVTARQSESIALEQVKSFGWENIFTKVLVTQQQQEKHDLIKNAVQITPEDWFIGDTGKDIQTGKLLGMKTAAVLSGFLSKESLLPYQPDIIINTVLDLKIDKITNGKL